MGFQGIFRGDISDYGLLGKYIQFWYGSVLTWWHGVGTRANDFEITNGNHNLYFDGINNRIGVGTNAPATALDVNGALVLRATSNQIITSPSSGLQATLNLPTPVTQNTTINIPDYEYTLASVTLSATQVVAVSAGNTLIAAQSHGAIVNITQAAGTLTIPAVANGLFFKCIVTTAAAATLTIQPTSGTLKMIGKVVTVSGANTCANLVNTTGTTSFQIKSGAVFGDTFDFWSDGTNWYVNGVCTGAIASYAFA